MLSTPILNLPQSGVLGMHIVDNHVVDGEILDQLCIWLCHMTTE